MKVTEHLKKAKETLFSYEILPPLKGASIQTIYDTLDELTEFKPPFIDVTYHREEYVYKTKQDGLLEKQSVRKRPGTVGICAAIMNKYNIDTVPHIICGGFNQEETENALIDLDFLGIDNLLVLRGDPINSETYFASEKGGHKYASDLVKQVHGLNNGIYLDDDLRNSSKTNFCMGVAGYPEKHFEAPNMNSDIHFLKKKGNYEHRGRDPSPLYLGLKSLNGMPKNTRDVGGEGRRTNQYPSESLHHSDNLWLRQLCL